MIDALGLAGRQFNGTGDGGQAAYQNDAALVNNIQQTGLDAADKAATAVLYVEADVAGTTNTILSGGADILGTVGSQISDRIEGAENQFDALNTTLFGEKAAAGISLLAMSGGTLLDASKSFQDAANADFNAADALEQKSFQYISNHPFKSPSDFSNKRHCSG